jgi:hypothetical protein
MTHHELIQERHDHKLVPRCNVVFPQMELTMISLSYNIVQYYLNCYY